MDRYPATTECKKSSSVEIAHYPIEVMNAFGDTCRLPWYGADTTINEEVEQRADGLQVFIDTQQVVTGQVEYNNYDASGASDTAQQYYRSYPCFIYNETSVTKWLHVQDGYVVAVQEALDSNYTWKPIQAWRWPTCGNSNYRVPVLPGHYALFKVPVYKGDFNTRLRVRIYSVDATYISAEYRGSINPKQFSLPKYLLNEDGSLLFNVAFIK